MKLLPLTRTITRRVKHCALGLSLVCHTISPICAAISFSCSNDALRWLAVESCCTSGNTLLHYASDPSQVVVVYVDFDSSSPWSYPPFCTPYLEDLASELCVYTNSSFGNGRGVSIFTTPSIAQKFATLQPFRDGTVLEGVNSERRRWHTRKLPGKGQAMMATTKLERGDHLTAFTPVLIVSMEKILPIHDNERFLRKAIDQLPPNTRSSYLALSRMYSNPDVFVQDILKSNAFEIQVGGKMHLAIFPEPARLNHDCAPNAQYYLDASLLTHHVYVTRPVVEDEEITISYTSPLQQTKYRQSHLMDSFGFNCSCSLCANRAAFDNDLENINRIQSTLGDWAENSTATCEDALELIRLYKSHGLDSFLDLPYGFAALTYNSFGDSRRAVRYARLAGEAVRMKNGPAAADFGLWESIAKEPKSHWSWRYRLR